MKILIVGIGKLGGGLAFELTKQGKCEIYLYGNKAEKTIGKTTDLKEINSNVKITALENLANLPKLDLTIFAFSTLIWTPSINVNDRIIDAKSNMKIIDEIAMQIPLEDLGSIIIASNPVDILTRYCFEVYGADNVFGFGNSLDELRIKNSVQLSNNDINKNDLICIGEHGESIVPLLSQISNNKKIHNDTYTTIKSSAFERTQMIIKSVSIPFFAPLFTLTSVIESIINKESKQITLSKFLHDEYLGVKGISIGVPILLQEGQFNRIKNIEISSYENELFIKSANQLEKQYLSLT